VFVDGKARSFRQMRIAANSPLRLSLNIIDADNGQTLRRLGSEVVFERDTTRLLRQGERLQGFAGRRVVVRPSFAGTTTGRDQLGYTLVHVHTLLGGFENTPSLVLGSNTQQSVASLPTAFLLHPNYPNPFNPTTAIRFDLPDAGNVSLVVFDVLGEQVAELSTGHKEAGYHSATWNAEEHSSGVYFARFTAASSGGRSLYAKVNKLVLMK